MDTVYGRKEKKEKRTAYHSTCFPICIKLVNLVQAAGLNE